MSLVEEVGNEWLMKEETVNAYTVLPQTHAIDLLVCNPGWVLLPPHPSTENTDIQHSVWLLWTLGI